MIIAIDGPSAAGKGTIARAVARELGYHFLDTGKLYRMVGFELLRRAYGEVDARIAAEIAAKLEPSAYEDRDLRSEEVAAMASRVAALPEVRTALLKLQREFAEKPPGAVLDGRDIGTVVCPHADLKFFITASSEVRARRRTDELRSLGKAASFEQVLADIQTRDVRDQSRSVAPTQAAADAIIIDTSELDREEALRAVMQIVRKRM